MLLLTLRGTPTIYNGDELGMELAHIPSNRVQDPFELNVPGLGLGRDGARSPMPWSDQPNAGFSIIEPWCPLIADWQSTNVATLDSNPTSMLTLHRQLLRLRKHNPALMAGSYTPLLATGDTLVYARHYPGCPTVVVALNLGQQAEVVQLESFQGRILLSTLCDRGGEVISAQLRLRPNEGVMLSPDTVRADGATH
jgi:alpha-glucosidase